MSEEHMITATRADIDDAVFGAAEDIAAETEGLTMRQRMKMTLDIADRVMQGIDMLDPAARRSEAARKAATARHAKPKPGPAIPAERNPITGGGPVPTPAPDPSQGQSPLVKPPVAEQAKAPLPPPPHPALAPRGADTAQPFGSPPA